MDTHSAKPVARRRYFASVLISKVISRFALLPQLAADRYLTVVVHMGDEVGMQKVRDYSTNVVSLSETAAHNLARSAISMLILRSSIDAWPALPPPPPFPFRYRRRVRPRASVTRPGPRAARRPASTR